jgi:transmembrane protein DUF3556
VGFPLLTPTPPPYDALEWEKRPFPEKCRMVCEAWALQGYGSPVGALVLYAVKVAFYIGMWIFFCRFSPGLGDIGAISSWWLEPVAFQKAILWSMLFEGLGLGCGSGPLTGRYFPPIGGFLYFLRPGTTKRPLFEGLPLFGGHLRTPLDVMLYLATQVCLVRALVAPAIGASELVPLAVLVPILGLTDKTLFLCARAEHYYTMLIVFLFADDWIAGAKAVQLALWFWAGVSKLNHHFPAVVCVMISNSPVVRLAWFKKLMYRAFPADLRPSRLAVVMSHMGTVLELGVPIVLALGSGDAITTVGLVMMVLLHGFITSSVPMGVPIEWNVIMVYGGFFLFSGDNAKVGILSGGSPMLYVFLAVALIVVPSLGNLVPRAVSFLLAMRYYAGNWPFSVWLFKGDSYRKLDRLKKTSPWILDQLARFYDRKTSVGLVGKVIAFRAMHLHGRSLQLLLPKAVDRVEDYEWVDGELIAGLTIGWNFGDGHLHDEGLLRAVQAQCGFEEGELRCIFVESQPLFGSRLEWRIADAKAGVREKGEISIAELTALQPWPAA